MKDFPRYGKRDSESLIRKKTVIAKQSSLKFAISWILMIAVALFFVQQRISYIRLEKKVSRLTQKKDEIQLSILPLKLEERYLTQEGKVEKIARSKLDLQTPREVQIIKLQVDETKKPEN